MTIDALKIKRAKALQDGQAVIALSRAESRDLTADERAKAQGFIAEADSLAAQITQAEADAAMAAKLDADAATLAKSTGRKTAPDTLGVTFGNQRDNIIDDPKKGFKTPRDFMLSVIRAGREIEFDPRLKLLTVGSDEGRTNSDPAGGFLIPEGFSPSLLQIQPEDDPIGPNVQPFPMERSIVKIPARVDKNHSTSVSGGLVVTRRNETVAATSSQMTFEQVSMEAHSLFGLSYATEEILTDSPISFAALLAAGFSDQFTSHLINERLNGTGIGEFQGIMTAACTVSVSKESGQSAATIVKENIDNMRSRCWGYGKAIWLYNHDCLPQLRSLHQVIGVGGSVVPYFTVDANGVSMLDGRPAYATEYCKTLGTVGDLVLGNWSQYLEGTYQPLQSAESIHVRFLNHERTFKFWLRNAGQPWWKSALTPKNSVNTLSPFVTLATRA